MVETQSKKAANQPYCGNCGYVLTGLTESSKCPECGKPLVEVLTRPSDMLNFGKRYRSNATLFGLPVIDVAVGPKNGEMRGKARGIIAVGDIATGGIAIGGIARGVVTIGGLSLGVCSVGGLSIGLLAAVGGGAIGGLAAGGGAAGILASGGGAVGVVAQGGGAFGKFTRDFRGALPLDGGKEVFERFAWFFGSWPPTPATQWHPMTAAAVVIMAVGFAILLAAWFKIATTRDGTANAA